MGRNSKRGERPFLKEVVTSLPGLHRHTEQLEPDDIPADEFVEVSTGEDDAKPFRAVRHWVIGLAAWAAWLAWTINVWFFSGSPLDDLVLAGIIWFVTFIITIIGVPAWRRKARNRVRRD
jgi:hypothetical protein